LMLLWSYIRRELISLLRERRQGTKMPNKDVKTIQDLIYYQYAKIIA
jgi:hypothetical protein